MGHTGIQNTVLKAFFPPHPINFKQVLNSSFIGLEHKDATSQPTIQPDLPVLASTGKQFHWSASAVKFPSPNFYF